LVPNRPIWPVKRQPVRQHRLAQKRLGDARLQPLGDGDDLFGGVGRTGADQHGDALAAVQDVGGALEIVLGRHDSRPAGPNAGVDSGVGVRWLGRVGFLDVVGKDHHRHAASAAGKAHGTVDEVARLGGCGADLHVGRNVLHQGGEIDLLLIVAAQCGARLLADDRHDGLMVELGVVQPVQQMDGAGAGGRETDADLAGEPGVAAGHERGFLLVPHLHEVDAIVLHAAERRQDAVDAVARVAEQPPDTPLLKASKNEVADGLGHSGCSRDTEGNA
jgi:hypothetical protein